MRLVLAVLLSATAASGATYALCRRTCPASDATPPVMPAAEPAPSPVESPPAEPPQLQAADRSATERERWQEEVDDLKRRLEVAEADVTRLRGLVGGNSEGIDRATVADLLDLTARARQRLQDALLTPPAEVRARYANFLAGADTGVARILPRGEYEHAIVKRGGGAYYSFATRDNSYNEEPDLQLSKGIYSSGFYGGTWGHVLDVGPVPVESVPDTPATLPAGVAEELRPRWEFLWTDAKTGQRRYSSEFGEAAGRLGRDPVPAVIGHTYLVRAILPGEHDHLVAFSPVEEDEHGHTLVWRILRKWTVERR